MAQNLHISLLKLSKAPVEPMVSKEGKMNRQALKLSYENRETTSFEERFDLDATLRIIDNVEQKSAKALGNTIFLDAELPSSTKEFNSEENFVATLHSPIVLTVTEDREVTYFDLSDVFPAADILQSMGMLTFEIINQQNMLFVDASIDEIYLKLEYQDEFNEDISFTIRGTYLDGTIYDAPFAVELDPAADCSFEDQISSPWYPEPIKSIDTGPQEELLIAKDLVHSDNAEKDKLESAVQEIVGFFGLASSETGHWTNQIQLNF